MHKNETETFIFLSFFYCKRNLKSLNLTNFWDGHTSVNLNRAKKCKQTLFKKSFNWLLTFYILSFIIQFNYSYRKWVFLLYFTEKLISRPHGFSENILDVDARSVSDVLSPPLRMCKDHVSLYTLQKRTIEKYSLLLLTIL